MNEANHSFPSLSLLHECETVKPCPCKPLEVLVHFVLFLRLCGPLKLSLGLLETGWSRCCLIKQDRLHITDNKGLGEAPEPGLLADTLITALRPRWKEAMSSRFRVRSCLKRISDCGWRGRKERLAPALWPSKS